MSDIYKSMVSEVIKEYSPDGLSTYQVKEKLQKYGPNSFEKEKVRAWRVFCGQFINPLSMILLFAAGLSVFMGKRSDGAVILTIVLLNSFLSFIQEYRSSKAVEKLSGLIKRQVLVVRNRERVFIDSSLLVPGDVMILRSGDLIPADGEIMESTGLLVNESQLTGESGLVSKGVGGGKENDSFLYAGGTIERGQCRCIVCATGRQSKLGKIAQLSKDTKKSTPYQRSLAKFSAWLLRMIGVAVVFLLTAKAFTIGSTEEFIETLLFAVALAMTTVPEALPMITTINLSYGALQLAKQKVIVKRLAAIEGMGRINLLCTDKTGTLTEDRLTVSEVISEEQELFQTFIYASIEDLHVKNKRNAGAFDAAFLEYVSEEIKEKAKDWEQAAFIPFDSVARRKRLIIHNQRESLSYLVVVGAPETLLALSKEDNGRDYPFLVKQSGRDGMRQLAVAYKEIDDVPEFDILEEEKDLIFLGFAKLSDPLRKTAKATVNYARELGVDVKILTGDSLEVAAHIGKELGLIKRGDRIYAGEELEKMTELQFKEVIHKCPIFARVTPEQKYHIIRCLKQTYVVGYQGDGINDAPALKLADVSVAVHTATDVAKESADLVLLEDDLNVIINGIQYGRKIFVNINKYVKHAMIGNLGNFFSMLFFFLFFAADIPMLAVQLLVGNIIQDMPLMAVFSDSVDKEELQKPQNASQVKSIIRISLFLGIFTAAFYLLFFLYTGTAATPITQSTLFLFYNFTQILVVLSVRNKQFFWQGKRPSRLLLASIVFFLALSAVIVSTPFIAGVMGLAPLPFRKILVIAGVAVSYILLLDMIKVGINRFFKKQSDALTQKV